MRCRRFDLLVMLAFALVTAGVEGCTPAPAQLTSVWPVAQSEATVTPPAGLSRFPLTGVNASGDSAIPTVPLCVKVRDTGRGGPLGVGAADVVYETEDTGSGTQLACIFQRSFPAKIGPLGQAGMPDLWIVPQYHAMLFSAGATLSLAASMQKWPGYSNASAGAGPPFDSAYHSGSGGYVAGNLAAQLASRYGSTVTSAAPARLQFSASAGAAATPISAVSIPFSASKPVSWSFDVVSGRYLRNVGGKGWRDALTHKRVSARNIVVIWARYAPVDADLSGAGGFDVTLGGSGQVSVFRDGQRLDGRWKADGSSPPYFTAGDGSAISLAPGNTWFEVIPLSMNITLR